MGFDTHRGTVQTWVKKADIPPSDGAARRYLIFDETVIQLCNDRYWLYAVKADTTGVLHVKYASTRNQAMALLIAAKLRDNLRRPTPSFLPIQHHDCQRLYIDTISDSSPNALEVGLLSNVPCPR